MGGGGSYPSEKGGGKDNDKLAGYGRVSIGRNGSEEKGVEGDKVEGHETSSK